MTEEERDRRILEITKELCAQLNISNCNPAFVVWKTMYGQQGRKVTVEYPPDDCRVNKQSIILPASMQGRLEPDEFRPIIASSLIYSKHFRRRILEGILLGAVPYVPLVVLLFFALPILLPGSNTACKAGSCETSPLGIQIARLIPFLAVPVFAIVVGTFLRRGRFAADRKAADIVGAMSFLAVLNKILEIKDGIVKRTGIPLLPSIQSRISNVQNYSGPG